MRIIIPFFPGSFATALEYMICRFTDYPNSTLKGHEWILPREDGSMHNYKKQKHPTAQAKLHKAFNFDNIIMTPTYPMVDMTTQEVFEFIDTNKKIDDKILILGPAANKENSELYVIINQFYKIVVPVKGDDNWYWSENDKNTLSNIKQWNKKYNSFRDMQIWQKREFLSMKFSDYVEPVPEEFLSKFYFVDCKDFVFDIENKFLEICNFLNLNIIYEEEFLNFSQIWKDKQMQIYSDVVLVQDIIEKTIHTNDLIEWENKNLVLEALVQMLLARNGYEIECYGLNIFPNNSKNLRQILIKI